jgi:hypothetical protein
MPAHLAPSGVRQYGCTALTPAEPTCLAYEHLTAPVGVRKTTDTLGR